MFEPQPYQSSIIDTISKNPGKFLIEVPKSSWCSSLFLRLLEQGKNRQFKTFYWDYESSLNSWFSSISHHRSTVIKAAVNDLYGVKPKPVLRAASCVLNFLK